MRASWLKGILDMGKVNLMVAISELTGPIIHENPKMFALFMF